VEAYAKTMESTMNVYRPEELKDVVVNFFALTSEGRPRDLLARHSYVHQAYIWNMSKRDFEELYHRARELWPGPAPPFDDVWRLYGGNPRRLKELAEFGWNVEGHLKHIAREKRVEPLARYLRKRGLAELALRVVEDPDYISYGEEVELLKLERILVRANLLMELPRGIELGGEPLVDSPFEPPPIDRELGIGEDYAW